MGSQVNGAAESGQAPAYDQDIRKLLCLALTLHSSKIGKTVEGRFHSESHGFSSNLHRRLLHLKCVDS